MRQAAVTILIPTTTVVTCPATLTYDGVAKTPCSASVTGAGGLNLTPAPVYENNTNAGTATASYTFAGNSTYASSSDQKTFNIERASSTTTVTCGAGPFIYDGNAKAPCSTSVTGVGGLNLTPTPDYADNVNPGTATASYTFSGDTNHTGSSDQKTFSIQAPTTTVVTDNATTIPGGPAPVTFGGTIVFTATVSSAQGTPNGTVRWTLSHDAYDPYPPSMAELNAGSGIVGACQGDIPVVNGVATCSVTPGYYWVDDYNQAPFNWAINATATFTPAVGSPFVSSSGSDSTNKITKANGLFQEPFSQFHPNNSHLPVSTSSLTFVTDATDSLGRPLKYHWCTSTGVPCGWSLSPSVTIDLSAGVIIVELAYVCPQGVDEPVSFECNRNVVSIYITKN